VFSISRKSVKVAEDFAIMGELVKAFKDFIARDLIFIIGGSSVILAFLYLFDCFHPYDPFPVPYYLIAAGIAYTVGYALQDFSCLIGFVTTARLHTKQPNCFVQCLYSRFLRGEPWENTKGLDLDRAADWIKEKPHQRAEYERIITLMQVGTTMGPCSFVSEVLVLLKSFSGAGDFNCVLGILALLFSVILILLGWLKAAQQTQFLARIARQEQYVKW
jgi:hypothetical protein